MTTDNKIRDEKVQCCINTEAAKISALSSGKVDKYEYLTGDEILSSDHWRVIQQAKFTYSPLGKALEKQTIEDQGKKQIKATEYHWKQLVESNELIKKGFNINRDSIPLEEKKIKELVEEIFCGRILEFRKKN